MTLNGTWKIIIDPLETGYNDYRYQPMDKLLYYEGTIWYRKQFDIDDISTDKRYFVWFGAANYRADVYLNGKKLGVHIGGFTPFNFEVTDILKDKENFLIVKVDNKRSRDAVPTISFDWWNYGGLTRDVKIITMDETFVEDYSIQLDKKNPGHILASVHLNGQKNSRNTNTGKISKCWSEYLNLPERHHGFWLIFDLQNAPCLKYKMDGTVKD